MVLKNLSTRPVTLRDEDGNLYVVPSLDELVLDDDLIEDNTFKRWLRWRLRDLYISPFVNIEKNGVSVDSKPTLNFIEGTNTTLTLTAHTNSVDIQIDAAADVNYNNLSNVPTTFPIAVTKAGAAIGTRNKINFIEGNNITLTIADNPGSARVDVTIDATGELSVAWTDITGAPSAFPPSGHQSSHQAGGSDALSGLLAANAKVQVAKAGTTSGTRRKVNFIEGSNISITLADDSANEKVDVTIAATTLAPSTANYITTQAESGLSAEHVLGTDIVMKGTAASQGATGIAGRLYYITDSGNERLTRDTGSGWDDLVVDWDFVSGKPSTFAPSAHATSHKSGGTDAIKLDELAAPTDVTTLNATASQHGLLPKLSGSSADVFRGDGTYGPSGIESAIQFLTSDATLATANLFVTPTDLTRSLTAGTWLVTVSLTIARGGQGGEYTVKVWDGSLVYFGIQGVNGGGSGSAESISVTGLVTVATTTSVKTSIASNNTTSVVKATPPNNASGMTNKASNVTFLKVA